jgi:hypothetical protein
MRVAASSFAFVLALGVCSVAPLRAQKPRRASPTLVTNPAAPTSAPPTVAPPRADSSRTKAARTPPTLVGRPGVAPDSARAAGRNAPAAPGVAPQSSRAATAVAAFTAGLAIEPYAGESDEARDAYLGQFTQQLDSAIVTLVGVFRGTTGQPVSGADAPTALSARERERWGRCRDLHYDLQSYAAAMHDFLESLPEAAAVQRTGSALDSALTALQATSGCDDVSSMIAAPGRWTPWASQYQTTARAFYHDWYPQVRDVADRNRALAIAVNATRRPTERLVVPPGLARTPPYVGAGPR